MFSLRRLCLRSLTRISNIKPIIHQMSDMWQQQKHISWSIQIWTHSMMLCGILLPLELSQSRFSYELIVHCYLDSIFFLLAHQPTQPVNQIYYRSRLWSEFSDAANHVVLPSKTFEFKINFYKLMSALMFLWCELWRLVRCLWANHLRLTTKKIFASIIISIISPPEFGPH